ncbi:MAG: TIGR04283 family arsenosugar biosynthesis glycosyltransferase [Ghiorsea sp.]|nr:TIGR04283 family arsenosugar biosynthesis glycosyltransferase [Ghiorsea sp.]
MQDKGYPSLAIVIPVFNEGSILSCALTSLQMLAGVDDIIFVDGGSTDNTVSLIQDAGFVCLQTEAGRAKQMNAGTQYTTSDIILYLHVDTSIYSSHILNIKKSCHQGFLSGRFDVSLSGCGAIYQIISFFINLRSCLTKVSTGDQGIFVTRKAFDDVGGYPNIPLMEDVALSKALRKLGKAACLRDKLVTSSRRWEQHGVLKTVLLMWKLRFLFWLGVSPKSLAQMYKEVR